MVANIREKGRYSPEGNIERLLKAQIENAIQVGWETEDIVVMYSNFDFEFMDVKAKKAKLNNHCFTGSKCLQLKSIMKLLLIMG